MHLFRPRLLVLVCLACVILAADAPTPRATPLQQLFVLKEIKPDLERVGIIWSRSAAERSGLVSDVERAAASTGVTVYLSYAGDLADVAPLFRELIRTNRVQAMWIVDGADEVVGSRTGRAYLIKNATAHGLPLVVPDADWVEAGAHITFLSDGSSLRMKVNKLSAEAASIVIPEKYLARTEYLAAN